MVEEKLGIEIQTIITLKLNFAKHEGFNKVVKAFEEVESCYRVTG
jgi:hypothetical protein